MLTICSIVSILTVVLLLVEVLIFFILYKLDFEHLFGLFLVEFVVYVFVATPYLNLALSAMTYESKLNGVVTLSSLDNGVLYLEDISQVRPLPIDISENVLDFYNDSGTVKSEHLYDSIEYVMSVSEDISDVLFSVFNRNPYSSLIEIDSVELLPNTSLVDFQSSQDGSTVSVPFPKN